MSEVVTTGHRASLWARWTSKSPIVVTFFALILGLLVGAIIIITTNPDVLDAWRAMCHSWGAPGDALKVTFDNVGAAYRTMFTGSVINPSSFGHSLTTGKGWPNTLTPISETLTYATPLLIASIGVGIAFRSEAVINPSSFGHSLTTGKGWPNTLTPISETLTYATPLLIASIGVGIAF